MVELSLSLIGQTIKHICFVGRYLHIELASGRIYSLIPKESDTSFKVFRSTLHSTQYGYQGGVVEKLKIESPPPRALDPCRYTTVAMSIKMPPDDRYDHGKMLTLNVIYVSHIGVEGRLEVINDRFYDD